MAQYDLLHLPSYMEWLALLRGSLWRDTFFFHKKVDIIGKTFSYDKWSRKTGVNLTAPSPMIMAQSRLGEVTAQSRRGHNSVTARSQLSHGEVTAQSRHLQYDHGEVTAQSRHLQYDHGEVTAQSRHLQYDHGEVTARSQLNHGPGHGSVTAGCDHFGHRELTVSSRWAHGGHFFLMGIHAGIRVNPCYWNSEVTPRNGVCHLSAISILPWQFIRISAPMDGIRSRHTVKSLI